MNTKELMDLGIEQKAEFVVSPWNLGGYVRRKSRNSFALVLHSVKSRCRFGTVDQILEDMEHLKATGSLPSGKIYF